MTEHYYTEKQTSPFRPSKVVMTVNNTQLEMYTAGGIFSPKKLDNGTKLLIEACTIKKGWDVLDLGCGYGIVGIALKKKNPSVGLVLSDVNRRAIKLARMNLGLLTSSCFIPYVATLTWLSFTNSFFNMLR